MFTVSTVLSKIVGVVPNTEEEEYDPLSSNDDIMHPNDITHVSRF